MDEDIVPALLETINNDFNLKAQGSKKLKSAVKLLRKKQATYIDVNDFAVEVGSILADVLGTHVTVGVLPDGKMYFNIADRILNTTMKINHELISGFAVDVQTELNHAAGLKLKGQKPELNQDRIDGLVNRLSGDEDFDSIKWLLNEPIVNFSQSIVDDAIKSNVDFHAKAGLNPQISRRADGDACKWCRNLAGTYDYYAAPDDIYRRHERCHCIVEYNPKDGRGTQNSHSKKWREEQKRDKIEERKQIGFDHAEYKEVDFFGHGKLQDSSDKWHAKLTEKEKDGVYNYTFGEFETMNLILRDSSYKPRDLKRIERDIDNFSKALSKFELEDDIITFRGVSSKEYNNILKGNIFGDFKSTSTLKDKATTFAENQDDNFIVKFNIPKGTNGAYVGTNSVFRKESEFTLNKNAKYKTRIKPEGLEVTIVG